MNRIILTGYRCRSSTKLVELITKAVRDGALTTD